jgi:ribosomal protein L23
VYIKKEVTKSTTTRVDKEAIAVAFEAAFGIKIKSIRNMTGKDMQAFWDRFVEMSAVRDAEEGKK